MKIQHCAPCKIGACEPQCGLKFTVEDNRIIDIAPDPDHPISKGYVCKKGMAIDEYQHDPDRLLFPEAKTPAGFKRTSWATATREIGTSLQDIVDRWGPSSIATYWGNAADSSGIILANSLCAAFGSPNSFNVLSLEYTDRGAVAGQMFGNEHLVLQPDADNADFALLLGANPLVTQGMTLLQRRPRIGESLKNIQRRGGKVVVVDPRLTESAKIADQHVRIVPGTDLFLLLGMFNHITSQRRYDVTYVGRCTSGLDKLTEIGSRFSNSDISNITRIPEQIIKQLAEDLAAADRGFITTRVGVQTSRNTTLTEWLVQTLNALTGNIGRKGGLFYHPGAINNIRFIDTFTKDKNNSPSRIGHYPQIFGGPPASTLADDILSDSPERIRALVVIAGNPIISFPNTERMKRALERLELLVCIDIYRSDTGAFADYNLPAATIYEKGGLHFLTQPFDPYPFLEWRPKILEPEGEVRSEWDMVRDICRATRVPFLNNRLIDLLDRGLGLTGSGFTEEHLSQFLLLSSMSRKKMTLSKLKRSKYGIKIAEPDYESTLEQFINNPDRKIQLSPAEFIDELLSVSRNLPQYNSDYPFQLISGGRRLASFNSWTHNMPHLSKGLGGNRAIINRDDASSLGVADGDRVKLHTKTGSLEIPVELSDEIMHGVVMVHQFWGHSYESGQSYAKNKPGCNVNYLHSDTDLDKFSGMPVFNGTPCKVSRI